MNEEPRQRKKIKLPVGVYKEGHVFNVTICTRTRAGIFGDQPKLADVCADLLTTLAKQRESNLFAWCVMPDHIHLLIQDEDLTGFVRLFKGRASKAAREMGIADPIWQRGFFDHALRKEDHLSHVARYIWANPVRAGLVKNPGEYKWSGSLTWPRWREEYGQEDGRG